MGSAAARGSRAGAARSRRAGAAGRAARSRDLAGAPDLLGGPLSRPLRTGQRVVAVRRRALRRLDLDQVLDLQPVLAQEADPVAVAEVEVDPVRVGPLEAVHPEVGPPQLLVGRDLLLLEREHENRPVDEKDELAAGAEQTSRLRDPAVRI